MERTEEQWADERAAMVRQIRAHGFQDDRILQVMGAVRRHRFVPDPFLDGDAYADHPVPIGSGATMSQPYIVAAMTGLLAVTPGTRVLEIGTGSGYQAAVLAELGAEVYSLERIPELTRHAKAALAREGYETVHVRTGDGYGGWPESAPFAGILAACAPEEIPPDLFAQLVEGGRMVIPLGGGWSQRLVLVRKRQGRQDVTEGIAVRFVPMVRP